MMRPLCHCCGKPIPKRTELVWVRDPDSVQGGVSKHVSGPLHSKTDCQRHVNQQVVSVSYMPRNGERRVSHFTTWDGESYVDEFFCKGSCATQFAYVMARAGRCTNFYNEAIAKQQERDEAAA